MRWVLLIFLLFPHLVFGQKLPDEYDMYSKYLKIFQDTKKVELNLVIMVSSTYGKKNNESDLGSSLIDFRNYLRGNKSDASAFFQCEAFRDTLNKDTLWLPLIDELNKKLAKDHNTIRNQFSEGLKINLLTYNHYDGYFGDGDIDGGWATFHEDYGDKSALINLSQVVNDGKRAVFYFSSQCGGLCGEGRIVLFYKDRAGWRFVIGLPLWAS